MEKPSKKSIRIISPSGKVNPDYIAGATQRLAKWGFEVSEGEFAREVFGRYAGTETQRIADLQTAINDENLSAILCSRGGYGLVQIIDKIDLTPLIYLPKYLIGFSDITVLHAALSKYNIPSVHAVMAKQLTELDEDSESLQKLKAILMGELPTYKFPSNELNKIGKAQGKLIGGNLSVLMGLRNTAFEPDYENAILLIEDIGEEAYRIDRMLQNLRLGGVFDKIAGLIVGHFTDCPEDTKMQDSIQATIANMVADYDFPVCMDFPAGHDSPNLPLIMNAPVKLKVNKRQTSIDFS